MAASKAASQGPSVISENIKIGELRVWSSDFEFKLVYMFPIRQKGGNNFQIRPKS